MCKLSSSSHLPIPLLILHQSLYFVLRLSYALLLQIPPLPLLLFHSPPPPPPPHPGVGPLVVQAKYIYFGLLADA